MVPQPYCYHTMRASSEQAEIEDGHLRRTGHRGSRRNPIDHPDLVPLGLEKNIETKVADRVYLKPIAQFQ